LAQLQDRFNALQQGSTTLGSPTSDPSLSSENLKLKQALIKLKEVSEHDFKQLRQKIAELEKLNASMVPIAKLKEAEESIALLQEQLDVAEKSSDLIEELTNKNIEQGETIANLEAEIKNLTELKDYAEQLDAFNAEELSMLKEDLGTLEQILLTMTREER
jgi:dynactin 1